MQIKVAADMDHALTQTTQADFDLRQFLVGRGMLQASAFDAVVKVADEAGVRVFAALRQSGLIQDEAFAVLASEVSGLPLLDRKAIEAVEHRTTLVRDRFLRRTMMLPLEEMPDALTVAVAEPGDETAVRTLAFTTGRAVIRHIAAACDIEAALDRLYGDDTDQPEDADLSDPVKRSQDFERYKDIASDAPVIRRVNQLVAQAVAERASDIHLETAEHELRVRYRIDGVLHERPPFQVQLRDAVISRIKVMAKLNIAERRLAQDGRIRLPVQGREIDFRVSTTPAAHGESIVLRILDREHLALDFDAIGFDADHLEPFRAILHRPHGIVLVTGPTGSGKTTTLYTALKELNSSDRKILTVEDPIEYMLEGINQVQVKPQIGLTFAAALRNFLRQDPDILMVGEIRDKETAQVAVQSALTGHLVLSTVHTNNAASAIARLLDMGVEDYLLTSTINGVLAQRLVRKLCPNCCEAYEPGAELIDKFRLDELAPREDLHLHRPIGCPSCSNTGYLGRTVILEQLVMTDAIRHAVMRHAESAEIQRIAEADGLQSLFRHGLRKALAGITSLEEVLRVARDQ